MQKVLFIVPDNFGGEIIQFGGAAELGGQKTRG